MEALLVPSLLAGVMAYKTYSILAVPPELEHIPKIPISSLIGSLLKKESFGDRYENLVRPVLEEHGCALLWIQGKWEILISSPKHAREILSSADKFLKKPPGVAEEDHRLFSKLLGASNIVFSDGEDWRRHRRVINPAFKKVCETNIFGDVTMKAIHKIDQSGPGVNINVSTLFQQLTLDALGKGLFSYNFQALENGDQNPNLLLYHDLTKATGNPIYFMFPFLEKVVPSRQLAHKQSDEFRLFLQGIISERRREIENGLARDDLLTRMIQASEGGCSLTDEDVINDLAVFFLAGHDTTANTLTTIIYYLSKHHDVQEKARREILTIMNYPPEIATPTTDHIREMKYLNCIIKESMRIVTTVGHFRRYSPERVTLSDGFIIPANTPLAVQSWGIHHDDETYPDPYEFQPDRFLAPHGPENAQWMPFGSGSRMCPGINFSLVEQRVALAILLQKYTFHLDPASRDQPLHLSGGGLVRALDVMIQFYPLHP